MNWDRVPIVFGAKQAWRGIIALAKSVFVRFPMFFVGYRWCDWCHRTISPKEPRIHRVIAAQGYGFEERICEKCSKGEV